MADFRSHYEEIKAPESVDKLINNAIKKGIRYKIMRKSIVLIISIAMIIFGLLGTCYAYPTASKTLSKIPLVGFIFENFGDNGLKTLSEKGVTTPSDIAVTKDGDTITVKESYYDKSRISIGLILKGSKLYENGLEYFFYYNGEQFKTGVYGGTTQEKDGCRYVVMNADTFSELPDKFNLKLVVKESTAAKRDFEFNIPLDRTNADSNTKEVSVMKSFHLGNRMILVKNIIFSPSATTINYEYTRPSNETEYQVQLTDQNSKNIQSSEIDGQSNINGSFRTEIARASFPYIDSLPNNLTLKIMDQQSCLLSAQFDIKSK